MMLPLLLAISTSAADLACLQGDTDQAFRSYLDMARSAPTPETGLLILAQAWELRNETSDNRLLTNRLRTLVSGLPPGPAKIAAADLLARWRTEHGLPTGLHHILPQTTVLTAWTLSGSYRRLGGLADLDHPFPPEHAPTMPTFTGELVAHAPIRISASSPSGRLAPWESVWPASGTVYLSRNLRGPGPGTLLLETRQAFKVFLDGKEIFRHATPDGEDGLRHAIPLPLEPRKNHRLLIKLTQVASDPYLKVFLLPAAYVTDSHRFSDSTDRFSSGLVARMEGRTKDFHRAFLTLEQQGSLTPAQACFYASCVLAEDDPPSSAELRAVRLLKSLPSSPRAQALLARHYHRQGLHETALEYASRAARTSPNAFLPCLVRAEIFADKGWPAPFHEDILRALRINPSSPDALRLLARWTAQNEPEKAASAWARLGRTAPTDTALLEAVRWLLSAGDTTSAQNLLLAYEQANGRSLSTVLLSARIAEVSCRPETAIAILRRALQTYPHSPEILDRLASLETNRRRSLLRQALRLMPGDGRLRDRLSFAEQGRPFTMEELLDDRLRATALRRFLTLPPTPGTPAEILLNEETLVIERDGSWHSVRRQMIRINDRRGAQLWGNPSLENMSRLRVLAAKTVLRSGEEIDAAKPRLQEGSLVLTFPAVTDDGLIEIAWTVVGQPNNIPRTFLHASSSRVLASVDHPVHLVHHTVIAPSDLGYRLTTTSAVKVRTNRLPDRTVRWTITASNLAAIPREPHLPSLETLAPSWSVIRPFSGWSDLAAWYRSLTAAVLRDDAELDLFLSSSVSESPTSSRLDLLRRLYLRIGQEIRPTVGGPYTADTPLATVLHQGRGTEEERTLLMKHLLDRLGVTNTVILVRHIDRPALDPATPPHPGLFDSLLISFVHDGRTNVLDLSDRWLPFSSIGWDKENATGLDTATGRLVRIRRSAIAQPDILVLSNRVTVLTDRILLAGHRAYLGYYGLYAELFSDQDLRDSQIRQTEQRDIPGLEIDRIDLLPTDEGVGYSIEGSVPGFVSPYGQDLLVPLAGRKAGLADLFAASPDRRTPLRISAPVRFRQRVTYDLSPLGPGVRPVLPPDTDLSTPWGSFRMRWRIERDMVVAESHTDIPVGIVPPSDYPAFASFCAAADRAERTALVIRRD